VEPPVLCGSRVVTDASGEGGRPTVTTVDWREA
jgi:hypothetical protein